MRPCHSPGAAYGRPTVVLAAIYAALAATGGALKDQTFMLVGESPRLTAIAELVEEAVQREHGRGTVLEARKNIYMVDKQVGGRVGGWVARGDVWCVPACQGACPALPFPRPATHPSSFPKAREQELEPTGALPPRWMAAGAGGAGQVGCGAPGRPQAALRTGIGGIAWGAACLPCSVPR